MAALVGTSVSLMNAAGFLLILIAALLALGCGSGKRPPAPSGKPSHHGPQGFRNVYLEPRNRTLDFFRWQLGLGPREKPALAPEEVPPYRPDNPHPDLALIYNPDFRGIQVTWIGHATFLIQVAGLNILTDPMFSDRASPVAFSGPKRLVPPGVPLEKLPPIHAAVVSHNHYDHLDAATIARLGNRPRFFVPLGLKSWFRKRGLTNVVELDWWESAELAGVRFSAAPAQHFSMRNAFDYNRVLWANWVMDTPTGKIFFAGDTGYSPYFKEIACRLGPMRLALLPIGGYMPRWFMRPMHLNPPEAVQVHLDLEARQSIGMHWGTFKLTDEPLNEPPLYLEKVLKEKGIPKEKFLTLKIGETREFR